MKLDRNINGDGRGKYGLILQRRRTEIAQQHAGLGSLSEAVEAAIRVLEIAGVVDWGNTVDSEFFVIRLKDLGARAALNAYAAVFMGKGEDPEYASEIEQMAKRAGPNHPNCKQPD